MIPFTERDPLISEELKRKFREALDSPLKIPHCSECPGARGFVQVVEFLLDQYAEAISQMDAATNTMNKFIVLFLELEENSIKKRMGGEKLAS